METTTYPRCATRQGRGTTSRFRGVSWHTSKQRWHAEIKHEGRRIGLGSHRTEEAAAIAYDTKARELYGPLAYQNFDHA